MSRIEKIILRHSQRGMLILKDYLSPDYCMEAAEEILSWKRGTVFLTTGFYVAGYAETDGPVGIAFLALALEKLGFHSVIVTDRFCRNFFEPKGLETVYVPMDADDNLFRKLIAEYQPVGMISSERCGINIRNDYENMRGISIRDNTAPIDRMFEKEVRGQIPTIGVGDGGNEIGMGNLADVIETKLSLVPCRVRTDYLVIASVSNWGAYGLTACLQILSRKDVFPSYRDIDDFLEETVRIGSVDGVTHERVAHVDGYGKDVEYEIVDALHAAAEDMEQAGKPEDLRSGT